MKLYNLQKYAFTKNFFEESKSRSNFVKVKNEAVKKQNDTHNQSHNQSHNCVEVKKTINNAKSLFWAFFCILKGDDEYHLHQNNLFKIKNDFSMKFVETLKKEKVFMKQYKIRFHDVEASILYDNDINLMTLRALALFYKLKLCFIINNRYYIIEDDTCDNNDPFNLIHQNKYKFTYEKISNDEIKEKVNGKLFMDGTRTTLKAPGSYKLDELKEICSILNINTVGSDDKKKTKQQLYDDIIIKID